MIYEKHPILFLFAVLLAGLGFWLTGSIRSHQAKAQGVVTVPIRQVTLRCTNGTPCDVYDENEIPPYQFATLPHGRLYKAVHEGCELFIAESDWTTGAGVNHTYVVTTGRGCR